MSKNWLLSATTALLLTAAPVASAQTCINLVAGYDMCYEGPLPHKLVKTAAGFHLTVGDLRYKAHSSTTFPKAEWETLPPEELLNNYFEAQQELASYGESYRAIHKGQFQTGDHLSSIYVLWPKRRYLGLLPPHDFAKPLIASHTDFGARILGMSARAIPDTDVDETVAQWRQILEMISKTNKDNGT